MCVQEFRIAKAHIGHLAKTATEIVVERGEQDEDCLLTLVTSEGKRQRYHKVPNGIARSVLTILDMADARPYYVDVDWVLEREITSQFTPEDMVQETVAY